MSVADGLAGGAAWLQVLGYLSYVAGVVDGRIEPNPTSWLMWAYGTALVVVIQADQGMKPALLALPAACAACSVLVAWLCWRRGSLTWPTDAADRAALGLDLASTVVYVTASALVGMGHLAGDHASSVKTVLLVCVTTSTLVSFAPIVRTTRRDPAAEEVRPWLVWTSAYALLLAATLVEEGASWSTLPFWGYPAICMACSGLVGWWAGREDGPGAAPARGVRRLPAPTARR